MGRTCSMYGAIQKFIPTMDLREVGCDATDWIALAKDRDIKVEMNLRVLYKTISYNNII